MSENSKIQWTDDTYNPWRGCTKVSDGCKNCYAEKLVKNRLAALHYEAATSGMDNLTSKHFHQTAGGHSTSGIPFWGEGSPRIRGADLSAPLRWNKKPWVCGCEGKDGSTALQPAASHCSVCKQEFHRRRVFSLSLGDWLDDEVPIAWLAEFLDVVRRCENLDWLLVTKRPELWRERIGKAITLADNNNEPLAEWLEAWTDCQDMPERGAIPQNIMVLTSVENQKAADERIPALLKIPAARRGLSCEPLLGLVEMSVYLSKSMRQDMHGIDWVIVGGESGPGSRASDLEWMRSIVGQCKQAVVPVFVKQLGANVQRSLFAPSIPPVPIKHKHPKGGDMAEWPEDLQVREFYK